MNLRLIREPSKDGATLGVLFVDGEFYSFTLEDPVREIPGAPVADWKVPGDTAIPAGTYRVQVTQSQRFGRRLPVLVSVPGYTGVRIHAGNRAKDTEGCVLVGRARGPGAIYESRLALDPLVKRLDESPTVVWLAIENPPSV